MIIVGFDPGIATLGYGVIKTDKRNKPEMIDYGIISTPKDENLAVRLCMLEQGIKQIIEKYKPEQMAIEELFWNTNQKTGIRVSEARGVVLLCARKHGLTIAEYTPLQVKQAVVGYGRAEKKQVISMVTMLLNLAKPPKPDDTADALAIAICHGHSGASRLAKYYNK